MCHGEKAAPSSYKPFPCFLFSPKPRSTEDTEGRTGHHELLLALHLLHEQREYWDIGSLSLWQRKFYFTRKATDASQICQTSRRIHIQVKPGNIQVARNHSGSTKTSCGLLHLGICLILGISLISGSQINTVAGFYLSPSLVLGRAGRRIHGSALTPRSLPQEQLRIPTPLTRNFPEGVSVAPSPMARMMSRSDGLADF